MPFQDVLVDKAQPNGEDGATGGDNPVDDAHPLLEVVAQDGEGGGVHQTSSSSKHDAISEVQNLHLVANQVEFFKKTKNDTKNHLLVAYESRKTHPSCSETGPNHCCSSQSDLVAEYAKIKNYSIYYRL